MYAIIEDSGTQIMVRKDDILDIDLRKLPEGATSLTFDKVLAVGNEDGSVATLGAPYLANVTVVAEIVKSLKRGAKTVLNKYSRRKGYRRHKGHRQSFVQVKISEIVL
ncbi:MAG: 50S ribosomal protein L21 [Phycisphaerales bacterium]|nr:50S ribosomal protein L21 [Phycisphaerales bacterium]